MAPPSIGARKRLQKELSAFLSDPPAHIPLVALDDECVSGSPSVPEKYPNIIQVITVIYLVAVYGVLGLFFTLLFHFFSSASFRVTTASRCNKSVIIISKVTESFIYPFTSPDRFAQQHSRMVFPHRRAPGHPLRRRLVRPARAFAYKYASENCQPTEILHPYILTFHHG